MHAQQREEDDDEPLGETSMNAGLEEPAEESSKPREASVLCRMLREDVVNLRLEGGMEE